ncbi:unnamed protein product [Schistocephalus solidus]|uniref:Uncharacterized protein n=1 Tax=Schistocephalus solidus TaxID=70667 RepID=A0A183SL56_SCHSO|nr:unnamed protein product [Schistocephalus solidus]
MARVRHPFELLGTRLANIGTRSSGHPRVLRVANYFAQTKSQHRQWSGLREILARGSNRQQLDKPTATSTNTYIVAPAPTYTAFSVTTTTPPVITFLKSRRAVGYCHLHNPYHRPRDDDYGDHHHASADQSCGSIA